MYFRLWKQMIHYFADRPDKDPYNKAASNNNAMLSNMRQLSIIESPCIRPSDADRRSLAECNQLAVYPTRASERRTLRMHLTLAAVPLHLRRPPPSPQFSIAKTAARARRWVAHA